MESLEDEAQSLRAQGKNKQALERLEQLLRMQVRDFGADSEGAVRTSSQICGICNILAINYLQEEDFQASFGMLKRAEEAAEWNDEDKVTTCNNFACYYRKLGKTRSALNFLQRAQSIEEKLTSAHSPANTHLNMCAVLSEIGKHDAAREQAMLTIIMLQDDLLLLDPESPTKQEKSGILAIAFYNLAVEMEHLKRHSEAMKYYEKAAAFARDNLPPGHKITESLEKTMKIVTRQIQETQERVDKRREKTALGKTRNYLTNMRATTSTGPKRPTRAAKPGEDDIEDRSLLLSTQPLVAPRGETSSKATRGKSQSRVTVPKQLAEEERSSGGFRLSGDLA